MPQVAVNSRFNQILQCPSKYYTAFHNNVPKFANAVKIIVKNALKMNRFFDNNYIGHFSEILSNFIKLGNQTGHSKKLCFNLMRILIPARPGPLNEVEYDVKILHSGKLNMSFFCTKQEIIGIVRVKRLSVQSEMV